MQTSNTPVEKAEGSNGQVDARIGRALSEFLHAEKGEHGDETYRVHSGSGSTYAVDLDGPDGRFCSCADTAEFCKHILHVLLVETPETLMSDVTECEHGDEDCPGADAISIEDGEPESEGAFPCFPCFQKARRDSKERAGATNQPVMADGGQPILTELKEGQIFTDKTGTLWKLEQRVEPVDLADDGTEVACVRLEPADGDGKRQISCETFPGIVNDPDGRYTLVSEPEIVEVSD
ncbi:hypothetical protein [Halocatena marina]|uniref:hypothetical protein n=1 Tax=Halocatena marina TaxID=2934937 RepID=UPI00200E4903|nr:hypothetical protein [Halocatena marina]